MSGFLNKYVGNPGCPPLLGTDIGYSIPYFLRSKEYSFELEVAPRSKPPSIPFIRDRGRFFYLKGEMCMPKKVHFYHIQEPAGNRTPVGAFEVLKGKKKSMLESSHQHLGKGMYSFICSDPILDISSINKETYVFDPIKQQFSKHAGDALLYIKKFIPKMELPINVPFYGGLIGYVGYDAIRSYVHIGERKNTPIHMPDIHFLLYNKVIVFDHHENVIHYIAIAYHEEEMHVLEDRVEQMKQSIQSTTTHSEEDCAPIHFEEMENKEVFLNQVRHAKQLIDTQELEQVVLSKRFFATGMKEPFTYYKKLRESNPSPYMFYLEFKDYTLFGASPESIVQTHGNTIMTNPIAGTSPRGKDVQEDTLLKNRLLKNKKEINEHNMLVNLSKQEIGALCKAESITVPVYQAVEMYEYVMHIVSKVQGTLIDQYSSIDALIHCLPAGTVSGLPKPDAMCLINTFETSARGVYGGAVGYINTALDMNMVLAIRFMTVVQDRAYIQAGAGIISDSIPEKEYEEILHKARSLTNIAKEQTNETIH